MGIHYIFILCKYIPITAQLISNAYCVKNIKAPPPLSQTEEADHNNAEDEPQRSFITPPAAGPNLFKTKADHRHLAAGLVQKCLQGFGLPCTLTHTWSPFGSRACTFSMVIIKPGLSGVCDSYPPPDLVCRRRWPVRGVILGVRGCCVMSYTRVSG